MTLKEQIMKLQTYKMFEGEDTVYVERDEVLKLLAQEPCEDAISREELLKAIDTWDKFGCDADTKLVPHQDHYIPYIHYDDVVKGIKEMPTVTPQPNIGHWIKVGEGLLPFECSECEKLEFKKSKYCPNCGARMTESEET